MYIFYIGDLFCYLINIFFCKYYYIHVSLIINFFSTVFAYSLSGTGTHGFDSTSGWIIYYDSQYNMDSQIPGLASKRQSGYYTWHIHFTSNWVFYGLWRHEKFHPLRCFFSFHARYPSASNNFLLTHLQKPYVFLMRILCP